MRRTSSSGSMGGPNTRRVLQVLLRSRAPLTQSELARQAGLSRGTVADALKQLNEAGLLLAPDAHELFERAEAFGSIPHPGVGRPPNLLALAPNAGLAVGVDFGQRHVRVAVASVDGQIQAEKEVRRLRDGTAIRVGRHAQESLGLATELVEELTAATRAKPGFERAAVVGLAVGIPGPVDVVRGVSVSQKILPRWGGLKPADELRKRLRWADVPALLENDATLGALCEHQYGELRGIEDCVYVKWATGLGCGIILDDAVRSGTRGLAGQIGHMPVPGPLPSSEPCEQCEMHCLESLAGADAIVSDVVRRANMGVGALVRAANSAPYADRIDVDDDNPLLNVIELGKRDNQAAKHALDAAAYRVGAALGQLAAILNPKTIVIGGAFGPTAYPLITEGLRRGLNDHAPASALDDLELQTGQHTGQAAVRGAIALVLGNELPSFLIKLMSVRSREKTSSSDRTAAAAVGVA